MHQGGPVRRHCLRTVCGISRPNRLDELFDVQDALFRHGEGIASRPGHEQVRPTECPTGAVDQHLQVRSRIGGRPITPEHLAQNIMRNELAPPHQQNPQERPNLASAEFRRRDLAAVPQHHEPSEETDLERARRGHRSMMSSR
jgi:hypothetical protein